MARYRLRLLLQEFDLPAGETILGRSPECHLTLDDPLVSREHAKIVVSGDRVAVIDLGSRNGSKLNGQPIRGEHQLQDGDRLRVGNQEIVFTSVVSPKRPGRPTGSLRHCTNCQTPYAAESRTCPNCGHAPGAEDTLSGNLTDAKGNTSDKQLWSVQLQLELLDKALSLMRVVDAEQVIMRVTNALDELVLRGVQIDETILGKVLSGVVRFCGAKGDGVWLRWVLLVLDRLDKLPSAALLAQMNELPPIVVGDAAEHLEKAIESLEKRQGELGEPGRSALVGLVELRERMSSQRMRFDNRGS